MNEGLFKSSVLGMCVFVLRAWAAFSSVNVRAADIDLAARCVQLRNDDTIRSYDPSLRAGVTRAFVHLFPGARKPPEETELKAVSIRCMNGRLLACFVGANLPCGKMNATRRNAGAEEYCRANANADIVPAFATGHDTIYSYRCTSGRPAVTGQTFALDARGFAAKLWAPINPS